MKNIDIVNAILKYHPETPGYKGCDEFKCGDPQAECTGVAVSLCPTVKVIKAAAAAGCNLLIVHEPIFYQTPDYPGWRGRFENTIADEKIKLIDELGMTVWRDHDHMHFHNPDSIFTGVMRELGWDKYYKPSKEMDFCFRFEMPKTKIKDIANQLVEKMDLHGMRYIGNLEDEVSTVAFVGHIIMGFGHPETEDEDGYYNDYSMELMKKMEKEGVELIIPGETIEWTVLEYLRDAKEFGKLRSAVFPGHYNLEKLGMKDFAERIKEILADNKMDCSVKYIPTDDGFEYL